MVKKTALALIIGIGIFFATPTADAEGRHVRSRHPATWSYGNYYAYDYGYYPPPYAFPYNPNYNYNPFRYNPYFGYSPYWGYYDQFGAYGHQNPYRYNYRSVNPYRYRVQPPGSGRY